jgi:lysylphosphatidylglycerol synthetase-like protein (DUF2156 family)
MFVVFVSLLKFVICHVLLSHFKWIFTLVHNCLFIILYSFSSRGSPKFYKLQAPQTWICLWPRSCYPAFALRKLIAVYIVPLFLLHVCKMYHCNKWKECILLQFIFVHCLVKRQHFQKNIFYSSCAFILMYTRVVNSTLFLKMEISFI